MISLEKGEWIPNIQFSGGDQITVGTRAFFPRTPSGYEDLLKNEGQSPLVVRALSLIYDWTTSRSVTTAPLDIEIMYARKGVMNRMHPGPLNVPLPNWCTGLYGSLGSASKPYTLKLASPFVLHPRENILLYLAMRSSEDYFTPSVNVGDEVAGDITRFLFVGRGRTSGLQRRLGGRTNVLSTTSTLVITNPYEEIIDITSFTYVGTSDANYRHFVRVEVGSRSWSKGIRPFWMVATPFKHSRLDFSALPEGGLVLFPSDGFALSVLNAQYNASNPYFGVAFEAYQQVA